MTEANSGTTGTTSGTTDEAKHQASQVAADSRDAGRRVTETAKDEAARVGNEAKYQSKRVYNEMSGELRKQAGEQQHRAAEGMRSVGQQLKSMASSSEEQGLAADLVRQAGQRLGSAAGWLDDHDATSIMHEVKSYARRHPGIFIAVAAGAGILVGRFIKAATSDDRDTSAEYRYRDAFDNAPGYTETPVYEQTAGAVYEEPIAGATPGTTPPPTGAPVYGEETATTRGDEVRR